MKQIDYYKVVESPRELNFYKGLTKKLIKYLENSGHSTLWDLVRFVGGSDRRILRLLDQMVQCSLVNFKDGYFTSISNLLAPIPVRELLCPTCKGKSVVFPDTLGRITKIMADIYKRRPKPTFIFDQRPVTLDTTLRRVAYLIYRNDLQGKQIAILGDDDLTSLAIALTGLSNTLTAFEIDKRLVAFLRKEATRYTLKLEVVQCDFTQGIPSKYNNKFDVFLTDPTPTPAPFTVFVNNGLKLLKKGGDKIGYVSIYSSAMRNSLALQKILTDVGFLITDVIPGFTEYEFLQETYSEKDIGLLKKYEYGKDRLSFFEHLVRLESTENTKIMPIRVKLKDVWGTATSRVLADLRKDPGMSNTHKDKLYLKKVAKIMIQNKYKEISNREN